MPKKIEDPNQVLLFSEDAKQDKILVAKDQEPAEVENSAARNKKEDGEFSFNTSEAKDLVSQLLDNCEKYNDAVPGSPEFLKKFLVNLKRGEAYFNEVVKRAGGFSITKNKSLHKWSGIVVSIVQQAKASKSQKLQDKIDEWIADAEVLQAEEEERTGVHPEEYNQ